MKDNDYGQFEAEDCLRSRSQSVTLKRNQNIKYAREANQ